MHFEPKPQHGLLVWVPKEKLSKWEPTTLVYLPHAFQGILFSGNHQIAGTKSWFAEKKGRTQERTMLQKRMVGISPRTKLFFPVGPMEHPLFPKKLKPKSMQLAVEPHLSFFSPLFSSEPHLFSCFWRGRLRRFPQSRRRSRRSWRAGCAMCWTAARTSLGSTRSSSAKRLGLPDACSQRAPKSAPSGKLGTDVVWTRGFDPSFSPTAEKLRGLSPDEA